MDVDEVAYRTAPHRTAPHHNVTLQKAWLVACVGGVWAVQNVALTFYRGFISEQGRKKQSKNTPV